mmetsp:Transcript_159747/g.512567  ORF Transcript_159747/g.512567 Transcript_159747/m.512567 type:complete len:3105 (+) Transcript_159747:145-9459(+)
MAKLCLNLSALALAARLGAAAPHTPENAPWNVNFEKTHRPHEYYGEWPGHEYHPSPADWRSLSIYQLLTDRFADGNPRNNEALMGGFDVRDMTYRHGGDFAGLTQKLPYIRGLGCEAIWISPVFQNGENMYHQYAQHDFTLLDRRLGTLEELRNLTSAAHKLGMYVIIDVVMNHMGNEFFFEGHQYDAAPFRMHGSDPNKEYHLVPRGPEDGQFDTPVGKQPYMDFWYNNTWDKDAKYNGPVYGQYGEAAYDTGKGTYDGSDFHHNGDLKDYFKAWEIHNGKIYGSMDDLRLEHPRVMDKYIAMTKALIASADIDGFRVDTPMQVPLPFFKKWAPAMRDFAASLGKERFGIFGEFYVTSARYATMTGRGKDLNMWGTDSFIDGPATLKGGIVYSYYWYTFSAMVHNMPDLADGFPLAYKAESKMLDIYDPQSGRKEYAMWNFCNNHDNWRMQAMTGTAQMRLCTAVITFWPGVPLHYAGDEQDLNTPGSALDGWAREELSASMAWRAVRTTPEGNPADRDNFDMTAQSYLYVQRLNAMRRAYFGDFSLEQCDVIETPDPAIVDVLVFTRGCTEDGRVLLMANYNSSAQKVVAVATPWPAGTTLVDVVAATNATVVKVGAHGMIETTLPPLGVLVLAPGSIRPIPPAVVSVSPKHSALLEASDASGAMVNVSIRFDRPMQSSFAVAARVDGELKAFRCVDATDCLEIVAMVAVKDLADGFHTIEVDDGVLSKDGQRSFSPFQSSFLVARKPSAISDPGVHTQSGLICENATHLCHNAAGADSFRVQNVGENWSQWFPYQTRSNWTSMPGQPVLVQYHAEGSSAYVIGDCIGTEGERCHAHWHPSMFIRGDFNGWGNSDKGEMGLVDDFTWAAEITVTGMDQAKFAPFEGWEKSYGAHQDRSLMYNVPDYDDRSKTFEVPPFMSGSEASRKWMADRGLWSNHESLASGAEFAGELWVSGSCTAEAPSCPVPDDTSWKCAACNPPGIDGCLEYAAKDVSAAMSSCGACTCCKRKVTPSMDGPRKTCCILFNDLTLNYTVTPDLSRCAGRKVPYKSSKCVVSTPTYVLDDKVQAIVDASAARLEVAERQFQEQDFTRKPSPSDWYNEVAYSVFVDRFANGDLQNDMANLPEFQRKELKDGQPWSLSRWRHGGDLLGLKARLTYLRDLGVTMVAISPIFTNSNGEYHGYCTSDPTRIDPGFGDAELLQDLVSEAHELGLRVILEVEMGHACARDVEYDRLEKIDDIDRCVSSLQSSYWNSSRGAALRAEGGNTLSSLPLSENLPDVLKSESFFARCGSQDLFRPNGNAFSKLDASEWDLRQAGDLWTDVMGRHSFKFNTMDVGFQQVYTNLMKYWIAFADIDGLRVSDASHLSADFTNFMSTSVRHYAKQLGKDNFFVIGDLQVTATPFASQLLGRSRPATGVEKLPARVESQLNEMCGLVATLTPPWPGLLASYPIVESYHMRDVANGEYAASDFFAKDSWSEAVEQSRAIFGAQADLRSVLTGLETKDSPRLLSQLGGSLAGDAWRIQAGLVWSFTWYGIPEIQSGMEMGFNGLCFNSTEDRDRVEAELRERGFSEELAKDLLKQCNYAEKGSQVDAGFWRQDMFVGGPLVLGSAVEGVRAHAHMSRSLMGANGPHWCEDPLLDRENSIYRMTRALIRIRQSCPVLRETNIEQAQVISGGADELAYWKHSQADSDGSAHSILVILKLGQGSAIATTEYLLPPQTGYSHGDAFVDLLDPSRTIRVVKKADSTVLMMPAELSDARVAIFAPLGLVTKDDGGRWLVCSGANLPPLPETPCEASDGKLFLTWGGFTFTVVVMLLVTVFNWRSSIYLAVVKESCPPACPPTSESRTEPQHVLTATIEHTIPERGVKVSAGGLGKVLDQMLREHPKGTLSLVHPMFGDVDYGHLDFYKEFKVVVDGKAHMVKVYILKSELDGIQRHWYLLSHELFEERSRRAPYPSPMTKLRVLRFFSLWNQAVAELLRDLKPDVYHCMDYHAALAPLYIPREEQIPTILVLHNADYCGIIETDFINDRFWSTVSALRRLSIVFNLTQPAIRKYATFEGRFNMLRAGVAYIKEVQAGHGVCAVSAQYGVELKRERTLFGGLPCIMPLDNATDPAEDHGQASIESLQIQRMGAKAMLQRHCDLDEDPDAKVLIFIGRWVKQKGVDHIAMITPLLLNSHPEVQIVLAGPPDDACGLYAQELLAPMAPLFPGRLFVCPEFFALPGEFRRGAHLCFAPSCSEPFGYVDVEFGLLGVPSVGCAIGGLGKMPGVYFRQQNSDSSKMLLEAFLCAVDYALNITDEEYWAMAQAATKATFPFDTWRANLLEAYSQSMKHFKPVNGDVLSLNDQWENGSTAETIRTSLAHRKPHRFRRMSEARMVANQMQILDIDDDTEFLTQTVSEERVHGIMKETMAQQMKRGNRKVKDAETLQRNICLAEQRLTERNHMTQWLMKPLLRSKYLRIHAVIALCYIISPAGETLLKTVESHGSGGSSLTDDVRHVIFYASVAVGSMMWLVLSRGVPPNLLMAYSQITTVLFSVLAPSLPEHSFDNAGAMVAFLSLNGVLCASRLLFIIWNFNEDFHGGFQVACKRIGVLESLRTAVGMLSVIMNYAGIEFLHRQGVLVISLATAVALFKAPHCYCAYSLPSTGVLDGLFLHKSFWLLLVSEMLNYSANYSSQTYNEWYTLNGWANDDIIYFSLIVMLVSAILLPFIFGMLTKMSVWGPWAMRDFTCMIPPGGLLRALALYDIGYLHHRSYLFAAALIASYCIDVVRSASVFASLMTILGNKWYALKGCYMVIFLTAICSCISPYLGNWIALAMCNASVFERVTLHTSMASHKGSLGEAIFWAVVPLSALAYLFQLITLRFFNSDILTFKGNGSLLPDGSRMLHTSTRRVPISELKRIRKSGGSLRLRQSDSGEPCEQDQLDDDGCSRASGPPNRQSTLHTVVEVVGPQGDDARSQKSHHGHPPRRQSSQSGVSSHRGFSRTGSMPCSENVSEIEQTILFNLADRAGSKAGSVQAPSRASSVVSRMANVVALGEDLEMRRSASDDSREHHLIFENHPPALLREASIESASSRDSASSVDSPTVVQVSPGAEDIGRFGDICSI